MTARVSVALVLLRLSFLVHDGGIIPADAMTDEKKTQELQHEEGQQEQQQQQQQQQEQEQEQEQHLRRVGNRTFARVAENSTLVKEMYNNMQHFVTEGPWQTYLDPGQKAVELGAGTFGVASLVAVRDNCAGGLFQGKLVVKSIKLDNPANGGVMQSSQMVQSEMAIQERLGNSHPNLMAVYDTFPRDPTEWPTSTDLTVYLLLPNAAGGDVDKFVHKSVATVARDPNNGLIYERVDWHMLNKLMARIALDLLAGLEHMHNNHFVHCDIKPANAMVSKPAGECDPLKPDCKFWLADFGLSTDRPDLSGIGGTPHYMPPETGVGLAYQAAMARGYRPRGINGWLPAGDVFSLGVTFLQILLQFTEFRAPMSNNVPHHGFPFPEGWRDHGVKAMNGQGGAFDFDARFPQARLMASQVHPALKDMINRMLNFEWAERLTAAALHTHVKTHFHEITSTRQAAPAAVQDDKPFCVDLCVQMKCCTDVHCELEKSQEGSAREPKKCAANRNGGRMPAQRQNRGKSFKCTEAEHLPKSLEKPKHRPHTAQEPQKFSRGMFVDYQNPDYSMALEDNSRDNFVRCKVKETSVNYWVQLQYGDLWLSPEHVNELQPVAPPRRLQPKCPFTVGKRLWYTSPGRSPQPTRVVDIAGECDIHVNYRPNRWFPTKHHFRFKPRCKYSVNDLVTYASTSHQQYVAAKVTEVYKNCEFLLDVKPKEPFTDEEDPRVTRRAADVAQQQDAQPVAPPAVQPPTAEQLQQEQMLRQKAYQQQLQLQQQQQQQKQLYEQQKQQLQQQQHGQQAQHQALLLRRQYELQLQQQNQVALYPQYQQQHVLGRRLVARY